MIVVGDGCNWGWCYFSWFDGRYRELDFDGWLAILGGILLDKAVVGDVVVGR